VTTVVIVIIIIVVPALIGHIIRGIVPRWKGRESLRFGAKTWRKKDLFFTT
jgi:ACR3 family arsenite efflux pump ArsB